MQLVQTRVFVRFAILKAFIIQVGNYGKYPKWFGAPLLLAHLANPRLFALFHMVSVVEWLKRRVHEQHGLASKPTRAILLCPWERYFTTLSLLWQAVIN